MSKNKPSSHKVDFPPSALSWGVFYWTQSHWSVTCDWFESIVAAAMVDGVTIEEQLESEGDVWDS